MQAYHSPLRSRFSSRSESVDLSSHHVNPLRSLHCCTPDDNRRDCCSPVPKRLLQNVVPLRRQSETPTEALLRRATRRAVISSPLLDFDLKGENSEKSDNDSSNSRDYWEKGLKKLKSGSWESLVRWEKENELLYAFIEDECEWLSGLFPDERIDRVHFFDALQDGVLLVKLAELCQRYAKNYGKEHNIEIPFFTVQVHSHEKCQGVIGNFRCRENVDSFLRWCRAHKINEALLFETNDVVEKTASEGLRDGAREIVLCLMEVARYGVRFGVQPPKLILLEKEIEFEEEMELSFDGSTSPRSVDSGVDTESYPYSALFAGSDGVDYGDKGKNENFTVFSNFANDKNIKTNFSDIIRGRDLLKETINGHGDSIPNNISNISGNNYTASDHISDSDIVLNQRLVNGRIPEHGYCDNYNSNSSSKYRRSKSSPGDSSDGSPTSERKFSQDLSPTSERKFSQDRSPTGTRKFSLGRRPASARKFSSEGRKYSRDDRPSSARKASQDRGDAERTRKISAVKTELDKMVTSIADNYKQVTITRIKEGKYIILGKVMFVRLLNKHCIVRIGGGWDTLEHYIITHLKQSGGAGSTDADLSPFCSNTLRKNKERKKAIYSSTPNLCTGSGSNRSSGRTSPNSELAPSPLLSRDPYVKEKELKIRDSKLIEDTISKVHADILASHSRPASAFGKLTSHSLPRPSSALDKINIEFKREVPPSPLNFQDSMADVLACDVNDNIMMDDAKLLNGSDDGMHHEGFAETFHHEMVSCNGADGVSESVTITQVSTEVVDGEIVKTTIVDGEMVEKNSILVTAVTDESEGGKHAKENGVTKKMKKSKSDTSNVTDKSASKGLKKTSASSSKLLGKSAVSKPTSGTRTVTKEKVAKTTTLTSSKTTKTLTTTKTTATRPTSAKVASSKTAAEKPAAPKVASASKTTTPSKGVTSTRPAKPSTPSKTTTPKSTVPKTTAPRTTVPKTAASKITVPKTTVPKTSAPKTAASKTSPPKTTVPKTSAPKTTVPKTSAPKSTLKSSVTKSTVSTVSGDKTTAKTTITKKTVTTNKPAAVTKTVDSKKEVSAKKDVKPKIGAAKEPAPKTSLNKKPASATAKPARPASAKVPSKTLPNADKGKTRPMTAGARPDSKSKSVPKSGTASKTPAVSKTSKSSAKPKAAKEKAEVKADEPAVKDVVVTLPEEAVVTAITNSSHEPIKIGDNDVYEVVKETEEIIEVHASREDVIEVKESKDVIKIGDNDMYEVTKETVEVVEVHTSEDDVIGVADANVNAERISVDAMVCEGDKENDLKADADVLVIQDPNQRDILEDAFVTKDDNQSNFNQDILLNQDLEDVSVIEDAHLETKGDILVIQDPTQGVTTADILLTQDPNQEYTKEDILVIQDPIQHDIKEDILLIADPNEHDENVDVLVIQDLHQEPKEDVLVIQDPHHNEFELDAAVTQDFSHNDKKEEILVIQDPNHDDLKVDVLVTPGAAEEDDTAGNILVIQDPTQDDIKVEIVTQDSNQDDSAKDILVIQDPNQDDSAKDILVIQDPNQVSMKEDVLVIQDPNQDGAKEEILVIQDSDQRDINENIFVAQDLSQNITNNDSFVVQDGNQSDVNIEKVIVGDMLEGVSIDQHEDNTGCADEELDYHRSETINITETVESYGEGYQKESYESTIFTSTSSNITLTPNDPDDEVGGKEHAFIIQDVNANPDDSKEDVFSMQENLGDHHVSVISSTVTYSSETRDECYPDVSSSSFGPEIEDQCENQDLEQQPQEGVLDEKLLVTEEGVATISPGDEMVGEGDSNAKNFSDTMEEFTVTTVQVTHGDEASIGDFHVRSDLDAEQEDHVVPSPDEAGGDLSGTGVQQVHEVKYSGGENESKTFELEMKYGQQESESSYFTCPSDSLASGNESDGIVLMQRMNGSDKESSEDSEGSQPSPNHHVNVFSTPDSYKTSSHVEYEQTESHLDAAKSKLDQEIEGNVEFYDDISASQHEEVISYTL